MAYTTIKKPSDYFNTKLYTGTGAEHNITGVGFQPDWTWIKERNNVTSHRVFDVIRGATVEMFPDLTDGESTDAQSLKSFDSDGFTLGTDGATNGSSDTYASWNWLADNTSGSANTDGSISSTVSANTTAGFSIVSYTGTGANATVGHGLGVAPSMIIIKGRSYVDNWPVYHSSLGNTKKLRLNLTNAEVTGITNWNDTSPTSSVFSIGTNGEMNNNGGTIIAYCFAEKQGFSKFGSYTGNGSTDGPFIYTGFKPAFVMIKNTATATDWEMIDNKRLGYNDLNYRLFPNTSGAENTTDRIADILSNGFKIRNTSTAFNGSGNNIIYMAFAEEPLVGDNPATAR